MAAIQKHIGPDWCHICGHRRKTVDIFYPENAEHDSKCKKYIRICDYCSHLISSVMTTGKTRWTTMPFHLGEVPE